MTYLGSSARNSFLYPWVPCGLYSWKYLLLGTLEFTYTFPSTCHPNTQYTVVCVLHPKFHQDQRSLIAGYSESLLEAHCVLVHRVKPPNKCMERHRCSKVLYKLWTGWGKARVAPATDSPAITGGLKREHSDSCFAFVYHHVLSDTT